MLRLLFTTLFCISSFILSECRMGWKSNANEFLVYSANTSFSRTNHLIITGKFSLRAETNDLSLLLCLDDHNGMYAFEVYTHRSPSASAGTASNVVRKGAGPFFSTNSGQMHVDCIKFGYACDFTVTVSQSQVNGTYHHSVNTTIGGNNSLITTTQDKIKWDLDKIKLSLGGYANSKLPRMAISYFHGCLSNVLFQGVDIIAKYFHQYPNNTNPVRSSKVGSPPYATSMQNCNDVTNTVGPTPSTSSVAKTTPTTPTKPITPTTPSAQTKLITPTPPTTPTTPTKKLGAAASYEASVFILVVAFLLNLLSFGTVTL